MTTILVVEDEIGIRDDICTLLNFEGYETIEAGNGVEALVQIEAHLPDLILCDIGMPEMDGFELIQQVKDKPEYAAIPFVFLSARTSTQDIKRGLELGAHAYLTKPFTTEELIDVVRKVLDTNA